MPLLRMLLPRPSPLVRLHLVYFHTHIIIFRNIFVLRTYMYGWVGISIIHFL
jgi:hypothetical protein